MKTVRVIDLEKIINERGNGKKYAVMGMDNKIALIENDDKMIVVNDEGIHYMLGNGHNNDFEVGIAKCEENSVPLFPDRIFKFTTDTLKKMSYSEKPLGDLLV